MVMDHRSVEWLHLLPTPGELTVEAAPASFSDLFDIGNNPAIGNGSAYVGWEIGQANVPALDEYASVVLVNPRNVSVAALESAGFSETRAYTALPSINDLRWLVPTDNTRVAVSSLRLADPWRFRDRAKKQLLVGAARSGLLSRVGDRLLIGRHTRSDLELKLEERLGCSSVHLALKTGPPRLMRKTTVQVMRDDGEIIAYAKLATSPDARDVVAREIACLNELRSHHELAGAIPNVLAVLDTPRYFASTLTPGPETRGPTVFGDAHREFLAAMHVATGRKMFFRHSEMWRDMQAKFDSLAPRLGSVWRSRLSAALARLDAELNDTELLLATAHRDFGPWNTRINASGSLFVFDWDGARREMSPLYDFLSFHFLDYGNLVRAGAGYQADIPERMAGESRRWGMCDGSEPVSHFLLAYLTELGLSRLMGALWRADLDSDPLLQMIADLLDSQGEWLPARNDPPSRDVRW